MRSRSGPGSRAALKARVRGASMIEFVLLTGAVALACVGAFTAFSDDVGKAIGAESKCVESLSSSCNSQGGSMPGAGDAPLSAREAADAQVTRAQQAVQDAYQRVWQWEEAARQAAIAGDRAALDTALENLARARADHAAAMEGARSAYETQIELTPMAERGVVPNFIDGFVRGDFAENPTMSATVGQVVGGFVPVWGQIGDVRDISAAVGGIIEGREGAWASLGLGVVGIIPGGDMVRGGVRVADGAAEGATAALRVRERLGEGAFSVAYREGDHVVKEIKDTVPGVGDVPVNLTQADKIRLANETAELTNDIAEALGDVVPRMEVVGDGVLRQPYVGGMTLDELMSTNPEAALRAADAKDEALATAARRFGFDNPYESGVMEGGWVAKVDDNPANFRFNEQGELTAWFDPVAIFPSSP